MRESLDFVALRVGEAVGAGDRCGPRLAKGRPPEVDAPGHRIAEIAISNSSAITLPCVATSE
jgi:hypothetical protein